MGMPLNRQGGRVRAPWGRARENRKFIQAPPPEIWSKTISGGEEVLAGKWGGLFLRYLLGSNYRRRDRDHLVPPRRMDAAVCRAEVCYPFSREHGRHRAAKRRDYRPNLRAVGSSADVLQLFDHVAIGGATEVMTGAQASRAASRGSSG